VLSDISALTYDYRYEYKKRSEGAAFQFSNEAAVEAIVSFISDKAVTPHDFVAFTGGYRGNGHQFLTGFVALEKIREWTKNPEINVILASGAIPREIKSLEYEEVTVA
jgi:homoserine dehydrogenase